MSSSATLERAVGQTPKQKYRPLSLGRSFDQDLFEEDLEREFKAKAIVTLRAVRQPLQLDGPRTVGGEGARGSDQVGLNSTL